MPNDGRLTRRLIGVLRARLPETRLDEVQDRRDARGRRWSLATLLAAPIVAMCAGSKSLAEAEALTGEMSPAVRRVLGFRRRVPDTTMRDALVRIEPDDLRLSLHAQIKAANRRKALAPVGLPFGVVAMDGKGIATSVWDDNYAQRQPHSTGFGASGLVRMMTCCLTSSAAKVCLDAISIPAWANEMSLFAAAFTSLVRTYGAMFQLVTYDAGAASRDNAAHVVAHGKDYLFALNGTQPTLFAEARSQLGDRPRDAADGATEDVVGPYVVTRRLYLTGELAGFHGWDHLRTVARVTYEKVRHDTGEVVEQDERYFLSSMPIEQLTPRQWMRVVRGHWAVENNCHHTWDTAFREDDHPWIEGDPRGIVVMSLLRRLAYNILALFRSVTQRSEERRGVAWKDLMRSVYNSLIAANEAQVAGLRTRRLVAVPNA